MINPLWIWARITRFKPLMENSSPNLITAPSDDQLVLLDEDKENLIPSSTAKKLKTNDDSDSSSDDIVTIDSSKELSNTLFEL